MNITKCMNDINKTVDDLFEYANTYDKIPYLTKEVKKIPVKKIIYLNANADRQKTILHFGEFFKCMKIGMYIESGIFEFTLIYSVSKDYVESIFTAVYNDKVNELTGDLKKYGDKLFDDIVEDKVKPQKLAFLKPYELYPEIWEEILKKNKLREEKKKNIAVTDLYQCWKCKERKCTIRESQTRGCDEPITKFITCTVCFTVMKK